MDDWKFLLHFIKPDFLHIHCMLHLVILLERDLPDQDYNNSQRDLYAKLTFIANNSLIII